MFKRKFWFCIEMKIVNFINFFHPGCVYYPIFFYVIVQSDINSGISGGDTRQEGGTIILHEGQLQLAISKGQLARGKSVRPRKKAARPVMSSLLNLLNFLNFLKHPIYVMIFLFMMQ